MAGGINPIGMLQGKVTTSGALVVSLDGGAINGSIATITTPNLGTTTAEGVLIINPTDAAAGAQQVSPALILQGEGWKTNATAASQTVAFRHHVLPVEGAAAPTASEVIAYSVNGGAYLNVVQFTSTGRILVGSAATADYDITVPNSASIGWVGRSQLSSPANGGISIRSNSGSAGVVLDAQVDNVLKVRDRSNAADATLTVGGGTTALAPLTIGNGTNLTTATANSIENDGTAIYQTINTTNGRCFEDAWNEFRLTGSGTGITTIADFFGSNDGIPLVPNGFYEIEWQCFFSQATAGTATWTIVTATTALANLTGTYVGSAIAGMGAVGAPQTAGINVTASSSTAFPVTGTEADAATHQFHIRVRLKAGNGASNTRLRLTMSAGTATPLINSYFKVRQLSAANVGTFVA